MAHQDFVFKRRDRIQLDLQNGKYEHYDIKNKEINLTKRNESIQDFSRPKQYAKIYNNNGSLGSVNPPTNRYPEVKVLRADLDEPFDVYQKTINITPSKVSSGRTEKAIPNMISSNELMSAIPDYRTRFGTYYMKV